MLSATNLTNSLATDYAGISATVTSAPSIALQPVAPQMASIFVDPNDATISPATVGAYTSITYKVNGSVVTSGFTEPSRPYTLSATFVLADGSNLEAGDFTIPKVFFTTLVDPSAGGFANLTNHAQRDFRFSSYYIDASSHYYDTYVLVQDGGGTTNYALKADTQLAFFVEKSVLESNNIALDSDFNMLFEVTMKRGMSYYMEPNERFAFDFDSWDGVSTGDGPAVFLNHSGFTMNALGSSAQTLTYTSGYTKTKWKGLTSGGWDSNAFMWPFEGNTDANHSVANTHGASKYYMIVQVKAQEKCTVRFYSHADGLGTNAYGQPSVGDEEFFYFEFDYPDTFSKQYAFAFGTRSALRIDKMVVTNEQTDLLNLLRSQTAPLHEFKIYAAASSNQTHSGMTNLLINNNLPDAAHFTYMKTPNYTGSGVTASVANAISLFTSGYTAGGVSATNFNNFFPVNPGDHLFTLLAPAGSLSFRFTEGRYAQPLRILKDDVEIHNDTFGVGNFSSTAQYITTVNTQ
tara:strand:+ start:3450 stop:5003 length:1554 start_codon:yes stop_codon:yes gene_type:complete